MLKDKLEQKDELKKLLYRRGYLLTDRTDLNLSDYPFYGNWKSVTVANGFNLYIHNEQHYYIQENSGTVAVLIGHAYNPFTMQYDENEILQDCIFAYSEGKEAFFDKVSELTGIHLICVFNKDRALFVQDCSGMQMCCYGKQGENVYITSNSAIIDDICELKKNSFAQKLINSKSYSHGSKYLPGDLTPFESIFRLGPNLFLEFKDLEFSVKRFYPIAKHEEVDSNNTAVIEQISKLVKNSVNLCAMKWDNPAISLSGGVDSRTTLSSASDNYGSFYYYSFESKPQEQSDAQAAHNICSGLGLNHTIYTIPAENDAYEDFELYKDIITRNSAGVSTPKDNEIRKYIFLSTMNDFKVELKSWASEIGRAFWERRYGIKLPNKLTPRHLSIFQTRYFGEPGLLKQSDNAYKEFMLKSEFTYPMYNYENTDIFYWEYRFGSWGTIVTTGQNIFNFEVTMPMNNRKIMDMFLWYPHDFRKNDGVNKGIIKTNNSKLIDIGNHIHNDYLNIKRLVLESVYYYYRTLFYK